MTTPLRDRVGQWLYETMPRRFDVGRYMWEALPDDAHGKEAYRLWGDALLASAVWVDHERITAMHDHVKEIARTFVEHWTHETNRAERIRDIAAALAAASEAAPVTRNRLCPTHTDEGAIVIYCQTCLDTAIETALQEQANVLTADFAMQAEVLVAATPQAAREACAQ